MVDIITFKISKIMSSRIAYRMSSYLPYVSTEGDFTLNLLKTANYREKKAYLKIYCSFRYKILFSYTHNVGNNVGNEMITNWTYFKVSFGVEKVGDKRKRCGIGYNETDVG